MRIVNISSEGVFCLVDWLVGGQVDEIRRGVSSLKDPSVDRAQVLRELYAALTMCL